MTRLTAALPLPALDLIVLGAVGGVAWWCWTRRGRTRVVPLALAAAGACAAVWLVFLAAWGWHYQVPTLERRYGLSHGVATEDTGASFARATVAQLNALHAHAHAEPWPSRRDLPSVLRPRMEAVLPTLGATSMPALPEPRHTLMDWYFRSAGIDGMTNPFGLEVIVGAEVLPVELPALVAHEYAHLAGFADEADASVVAWLAGQGGGPALRYSSALAVLPHLVSGLSLDTRRDVLAAVAPGPRADLEAIGRRLSRQRPWVRALAWWSYDGFLRANRVEEGVARYDAVARVLIAAADPVSGSLTRYPPPWPPPGH